MKLNPDDIELKNNYLSNKNKLQSLLRATKNNYYKIKMNNLSKNPKKMWNFVNHKIDKKNKKATIDKINSDLNNQVTDNVKEVSNIFNRFFIDVGPNLARTIVNQNPHHAPIMTDFSTHNSFFLEPTSATEITTIIFKMNDKKAAAIDKLSVKVLKSIARFIAEPLTYIINKSIETSIFPDHFKKAEVIPIYKAGDKTLPTNYRPISLISNLAKIYEKIIKVRLDSYIRTFKILNPMQYGFQANKKTSNALLFVCDQICDAIDNNILCIAIFLDLAKAFDTVNHVLLLEKLHKIGIRGKINDLLNSYLSGRTQTVKIQDTVSDPLTVICGVPQGTILGPLLFILYLNDIFKVLNDLELVSFADDTVIIVKDNTRSTVLRKAEAKVNSVANWLSDNYLSLNISKTNYITFGSYATSIPQTCNLHFHKIDCPNLQCNCPEITRTDTVKYLGVIIDAHMRWNTHVNTLVKKTRYLIYIFYKLRTMLNTNQLLMVYYALFWSIATYDMIVWGGTVDTNLSLLHNVHIIIKLIYYKSLTYSSDDIFLEKKILSLCKYFYLKALLNNYDYTQNIFIDNILASKRTLTLHLPRINKELLRRHHNYLSVKIFNILPPQLKLISPNKPSDLQILKNWFIELPPQTMQAKIRTH